MLDRQYAPLNKHFSPDLVVVAKRFANKLKRFVPRRAVGSGLPHDQNDIPEMGYKRDAYFAGLDEELIRKQSENERTIEGALERFKPQPYLHLAKLYRTTGYQSAATRVLVRLERNQTRYSDFGLLLTLWHWMLDLGIKYGHSPSRPIVILLIWSMFSTVCFQNAYNDRRIVALRDTVKTGATTGPAPTFNSFIYALDTLLPIVDLGQKKTWTVEPLSKTGAHATVTRPLSLYGSFYSILQQWPDWGAPLLLILNTFFGWLMTTLFVVGVTGLMRPNRDG